MKMFMQSLMDGGFVQMGQFLMLFMVALLLLYLLDEAKCVAFKQYAFLMLLILLCPITAKLLATYQTAFYSKDNLWALLPLTPLVGYGLVIASVKIVGALTSRYGRWTKSVSRRKESILEAFVILGLSMVLFLCGTLRFGKAMTEQADGTGVIPEEVCEVLATVVPEDEGCAKVLAADKVARWARIYDGRILLPYGRNMYEPEMTAFTYEVYTEEQYLLHEWINGGLSADEVVGGADLYKDCAEAGCEYLIFERNTMAAVNDVWPTGEQGLYKLWAETTEFVVYRLQ